MEQSTEKVSVNVNTATLSSIDLLVDNGYYSNRSDFINQSLRDSLNKQSGTIERIIEREKQKNEKSGNPWFLGVWSVSADELQSYVEAGTKLSITGYGLLKLGKDIPDELVFASVERIAVKGKVLCSEAVRKRYL